MRKSQAAVLSSGNTLKGPAGHESLIERLEQIDALVNQVLASWESGPLLQRRRWHRISYREPITLLPTDERGTACAGEPFVVQGHDLSLGGVSFMHAAPLPFRTVAMTFSARNGEQASVLARLKWCRFTRAGVYRSGGQFLRIVSLSELLAGATAGDREAAQQ